MEQLATSVREVVAIASGDESLAERWKAAEQEVGWLLKSEAESSRRGIVQALHERLSTAVSAEHDDEVRKVLQHIIEFCQRKEGMG